MSILHSEIYQKDPVDYDLLRSRMDHKENIQLLPECTVIWYIRIFK